MKSLVDIVNDFEAAEGSQEQLFDSVYGELKKLAAALMARESPGQTLQATALVHEMYMRLLTQLDNGTGEKLPWPNRAAFFGAAAESMRRILIDNARRRKRIKRGGGRDRVELRTEDLIVTSPPDDLLALDEALQKLETLDAKKADVVKLRYFAGLSVEETSLALEMSTATVKRYWAYSKAWLAREITNSADEH